MRKAEIWFKRSKLIAKIMNVSVKKVISKLCLSPEENLNFLVTQDIDQHCRVQSSKPSKY